MERRVGKRASEERVVRVVRNGRGFGATMAAIGRGNDRRSPVYGAADAEPRPARPRRDFVERRDRDSVNEIRRGIRAYRKTA